MIDEIAAFAPECLTILTGGEPLLRRDILEIVRRAAERGLWVVVGTNGVRITENLARASLKPARAGCRCRSMRSIPIVTTASGMCAAPGGTRSKGRRSSNRTGLPFIVQTTAGSHNLGELDAIADFAHDRLAAKVWNLYFLVPTGRGQFVSDITPAQYDEVLASLYRIQRKYDRPDAGEREVRAALHQDGSRARRSVRRSFSGGGPAGNQDLLRRRRRLPGGDALHGDTAERGCHPVPLPAGLRGNSSQRELSRISGRPRSCSPTSAAAPRSAGDAASAR